MSGERICNCGTLEEARHTAEAILVSLIAPTWNRDSVNCGFWAAQVATMLRAAAFKFCEEFHGTERGQCEDINRQSLHYFVHNHMSTPDMLESIVEETNLLKSFSAKGVPYNGGVAMRTGWDDRANPFAPRTIEHLDWTAQWHAANAECFRDHVEGGHDTIGDTAGSA